MAIDSTVTIPDKVEAEVKDGVVRAKGRLGEGRVVLHKKVQCEQGDGALSLKPGDDEKQSRVLTGTMRALIANLMTGVSEGFEKKLELVGVGYRAQLKGKTLNLQLGYSHPIDYPIPEGVKVETPSQTEIVLSGIDKQQIGQVAAEIRSFRPPEPYKGKGVKYADERILRKDAKKK